MWSTVTSALQEKGYTTRTAEVMISSLRISTKKQYQCYLKQFIRFTSKNLIDVNHMDLIKYLEHMFFNSKLGYSALNTIRSSVSTMMDLVNNDPIGQHTAVKRFMKGVYNKRPSLPRYENTWNPDIVIKHLDHDSVGLSLLNHSKKVATLLALCSLQRISTLVKLKLKDISFSTDQVEIRITDLMKQSRPSFHKTHMTFRLFLEAPNVCIMRQLELYISRTSDIRNGTETLFIRSTPPHTSISTDTMSNWIKTTLHVAGVDDKYKAHSTRAAGASKAHAQSLCVDDILKAGGWKRESTFRKFYHKPLASNASANVSESILKVNLK